MEYKEYCVCDRCKKETGRLDGAVFYMDKTTSKQYNFCFDCSFELDTIFEKSRTSIFELFIQPERLSEKTSKEDAIV
jgi:hypothetical protein